MKQEENPQPQLFEGDRDVLVMSIEISRENLKAKKEIAQKEVNRTGNFLRKHILRQESDREQVDDQCKESAEEMIIAIIRRDRFLEMDH